MTVKMIFKTQPVLIFTLLISLLISSSIPFKANGMDVDFYSSNDILFYNPDGCAAENSASYGSAPKTGNLKSFVDTYGQGAFDVGKKYGIPYEAILAQGILESGYGKSSLAYKYFNFFGIKAGDNWTGETVTLGTSEEYTPGTTTHINAAFRVYPSIEAGWEGYALFITNNGNPKRYKEALEYPGDYVQYLKEIKKAGYATSSDYVKNTVKLANAIAEYVKSTGKWPPSSEVAKTNTPTGGSANSSGGGCSDDAQTGNIVETALKFALDKPIPKDANPLMNKESDAKPAYVAAIKQYNPGASVADCGMFVATVMIASGADPSYPKQSTSTQIDYVKDQTDKYKIINSPKQSDLEPGDILIAVNSGGTHHTMIYTGNKPYPAVDASQNERVPSVRESYSLDWMLRQNGVIAARLISNAK